MHELGLTPDRPYRKCARVVGDVLGKYHPHGDQSVYDALVQLVQDFSSRYPMLAGHGNFGSVDNDPPAAMRYTDLGKAMRAMAEDGPIAAAFGVNSRSLSLMLAGGSAAMAGVAGVCLALTFTLAPSQIFAWVGVVFAAVMLGGLGSALGPLVAGVIIGVSEAVTMAVASPSWAPIVSFSLLIVMLLFRPGKPGT